MSKSVTRTGTRNDITGVLDLQQKNLVTNLSDAEKKNGFVTTPFTDEQLERLIGLQGLFVLERDGIIAGYAVAAGWDYFAGRPMFDAMIELFGQLDYIGARIARENSFQYGPVCVDSSLRGTSAFPDLFAEMKRGMAARYDIGTTFINKINERSYNAHVRKVNLDVINEFSFNGNNYYGLAFLTK